MALKYVGKSITRSDAHAKVTGTATYTADITVPRMLHAKVLRAGVPHAKIISIAAGEAEKLPGVVKIVTGRDCGILFGTCLWDQPPIATDKVRHAGEAVAVAVAETRQAAEAALKRIRVEYEELPFVLDPVESASARAPIIHERNGEYRRVSYSVHPVKKTNIFHHYKLRNGDPERGFAESDVIVEENFEFPISCHCAIEPHAAICRFTMEGSIEIWASNQAPFVLRDVLADMFALQTAKVRVHIPYLGGGFGGKSDISIEPLTAYVASKVPGYALKLVLTRREVFTSSLVGRGMKGRMKIGAARDGTLRALEAEMYFADGAYGDTSWPVCTVAGHNCTGPYYFPNIKSDVYGVYTNSPPVGAYRGYGHPEGQFMVGRMLDILARKLDLPLWQLMRKNFLSEGQRNSLGQTITRSHGDLGKCLDEVKGAVFDSYQKPEADKKYIYGRGLAAMMKSPKMAAHSSSGCSLKISSDGSVFVNLAGVEMGQGCQTVFAQMAAEALMVPIESVRVYTEIDTQFSPWDWQTVASMQTYRGGRAILQACERAIDQLKANAASVLRCTTAEIEYDGACYRINNPSQKLTIGSLARGYMTEDGLTVGVPVHTVGSYRVQGVTEPDPETGMGNAAGSWTFGCQAAEIRIERATGKLEVLHFASAFDLGRVINPAACRGQVTGGVVQGLGATLMEKLEFSENGTIRNANFGPYRLPRMEHMPQKFTVKFVETPNSEGPWSAKPIAEHPIVAVAPTILNAIQDATGVDFTVLPVTQDSILAALQGGEGKGEGEACPG